VGIAYSYEYIQRKVFTTTVHSFTELHSPIAHDNSVTENCSHLAPLTQCQSLAQPHLPCLITHLSVTPSARRIASSSTWLQLIRQQAVVHWSDNSWYSLCGSATKQVTLVVLAVLAAEQQEKRACPSYPREFHCERRCIAISYLRRIQELWESAGICRWTMENDVALEVRDMNRKFTTENEHDDGPRFSAINICRVASITVRHSHMPRRCLVLFLCVCLVCVFYSHFYFYV